MINLYLLIVCFKTCSNGLTLRARQALSLLQTQGAWAVFTPSLEYDSRNPRTPQRPHRPHIFGIWLFDIIRFPYSCAARRRKHSGLRRCRPHIPHGRHDGIRRRSSVVPRLLVGYQWVQLVEVVLIVQWALSAFWDYSLWRVLALVFSERALGA